MADYFSKNMEKQFYGIAMVVAMKLRTICIGVMKLAQRIS